MLLPPSRSRATGSCVIRPGFSLVEAILASALLALFMLAFGGLIVNGEETTALAGKRARALVVVQGGLEAARNLRDSSYALLTNGTHGIGTVAGHAAFVGASDTVGIFTRQVTVNTISPSTKLVVSTVTWPQNTERSGSISFFTYFTNWRIFSAP